MTHPKIKPITYEQRRALWTQTKGSASTVGCLGCAILRDPTPYVGYDHHCQLCHDTQSCTKLRCQETFDKRDRDNKMISRAIVSAEARNSCNSSFVVRSRCPA